MAGGNWVTRAFAAAGMLALAAAGSAFWPGAARADAASPFKIEVVAAGLDHPWSLAFLPDGGYLVTELTGQLRVIRNGEISAPVAGVPEVVYGGQGGLFDVVLHPDYAQNQLIYLTWSAATDKGNTLRVGRGRFTGSALEDFEVIFEANAYRTTKVHYGGRLVFLPDGTFVVTSGDGFDYREEAQNLANHFGTTIRLNADGSVPADNPFAGDDGALDEIYTYGHRNPQGLAFDPDSATLYLNEHGPRGGDEINVLEPGANYGWPLATYGMDYSGAYVSPYTEYEGTVPPIHHWTPSIAPSGMAVYRGTAFADWAGDLLVTALAPGNVPELADRNLRRIDMENGAVAADIALRVIVPGAGDDTPRLRDVRVAPDGSLFILTDGEGGAVLRLVPEGGMPAPQAALPATPASGRALEAAGVQESAGGDDDAAAAQADNPEAAAP